LPIDLHNGDRSVVTLAKRGILINIDYLDTEAITLEQSLSIVAQMAA